MSENLTFTYIRHILELAELCGVNPDALLAETDIDGSAIHDPLGRMSVREHKAVWKHLLEQVAYEQFLLNVNDILLPGALSASVYSAMCAENLAEFFKSVAELKNMEGGDQIVFGVEGADNFYLCYELDPFYEEYATHISEFMALHAILLIRWLLTDDICPSEIHYKGLQQSHHPLLEKRLGCPFSYGESDFRLYFPMHLLTQPLRTRNPVMKDILAMEARRLCDMHNPENQIRRNVLKCLNLTLGKDEISLKAIADELGMNVRTLQRNLKAEGYTFAQLLDETRKNNVLSLIKDERYTVESIMDEVGMYDRKHFYACFRKWTGMTPAAYRDVVRDSKTT